MKASCNQAEIKSILQMVRGWIGLLSKRDFEEAADYLTPSPKYPWTYSAQTLIEALGQYSPEYREAMEINKRDFLPSVTAPEKMDMSKEVMVIYVTGDQVSIEYELPINGKWSDLTAKFVLTSVPEGVGLTLVDLRVL